MDLAAERQQQKCLTQIPKAKNTHKAKAKAKHSTKNVSNEAN